jgi:hypothetical protein
MYVLPWFFCSSAKIHWSQVFDTAKFRLRYIEYSKDYRSLVNVDINMIGYNLKYLEIQNPFRYCTSYSSGVLARLFKSKSIFLIISTSGCVNLYSHIPSRSFLIFFLNS